MSGRSRRVEELDWQATPIGDISLRRRLHPALGVEVFEVLLGEEYLMSSLFTVAEVELARLALAACPGRGLDVVVGGLGLGCTARAALQDERVRTLRVVERLPAVVGWHERRLLPESPALVDDDRCALVAGDFFALVADALPFGDTHGPVDAVLLDVDHSPHHVLHPSHAALYTADGLRRLAARLRPRGVFALWSDDPPDAPFQAVLDEVFATAEAHVVAFPNPLTGGTSTNTVYVATAAAPGAAG